MLDAHDVRYRYRDVTEQRLAPAELRRLIELLGVEPRDVLRVHDPVAKRLGVRGDEPALELVRLMTEFPTLLQRPIGVFGGRAVIGRPPERLVELAARSDD